MNLNKKDCRQSETCPGHIGDTTNIQNSVFTQLRAERDQNAGWMEDVIILVIIKLGLKVSNMIPSYYFMTTTIKQWKEPISVSAAVYMYVKGT